MTTLKVLTERAEKHQQRINRMAEAVSSAGVRTPDDAAMLFARLGTASEDVAAGTSGEFDSDGKTLTAKNWCDVDIAAGDAVKLDYHTGTGGGGWLATPCVTAGTTTTEPGPTEPDTCCCDVLALQKAIAQSEYPDIDIDIGNGTENVVDAIERLQIAAGCIEAPGTVTCGGCAMPETLEIEFTGWVDVDEQWQGGSATYYLSRLNGTTITATDISTDERFGCCYGTRTNFTLDDGGLPLVISKRSTIDWNPDPISFTTRYRAIPAAPEVGADEVSRVCHLGGQRWYFEVWFADVWPQQPGVEVDYVVIELDDGVTCENIVGTHAATFYQGAIQAKGSLTFRAVT